MKRSILVGLVLLSILLTLSVLPIVSAQTTLPTCPIGTSGAPELINPHIASGALCRGACGMDCPLDRCVRQDKPITINVSDSAGNQYKCVYNNVLSCKTHQGCRIHDGCYDTCAVIGCNTIGDICHLKCDKQCFDKWGEKLCAIWTDLSPVKIPTFLINPDFDKSDLNFSDPPELVGPIGDNQSCSWSGTWSTNWGEQVMHQTGNEVSGSYTHDQGKIVGTISGNKLIGTWSEAPSYSPTQDAGDVELTLSDDCKSFSGNWRYGSEGGWSGGWTGTKA